MQKQESKTHSPGGRGSDPLAPKNRGGFLRAVPRWELRREISGLIFRDARRVQDLRNRCRELAAPPPAKHLSRAVTGHELIEELCGAPSAEAAFRAVFTLVKPRLSSLFDTYLRDELRVFDAPSIPVVESNREELERQCAWAAGQPEAKADAATEWLARIAQRVEGLGEALAASPRGSAKAVTSGRKTGNLPIQRSVIPDGFREGLARLPPADSPDYRERERFHAHNFLMEIQAADSCASLLFEAPDMPWDFYYDTARHMWDETRHVRYGQKWIPVMIEETGEPRAFEEVKRDAENWRRDVLAAAYSTAGEVLKAQNRSTSTHNR